LVIHHVRRVVNRWAPRSLFWRALLIIVLPIVILQLVLSYAFYNRHWDTVTRWLAEGVASEVAIAADLISRAQSSEEIRAAMDLVREHTDLALSFEPGARLEQAAAEAGLDGSIFRHIDNKIIEGFDEVIERPLLVDLRFDSPQSVAVYVQLDRGVLRVVAPRKRVTSTTTGALFLWMMGASAALALVSLFFMRLQIRPIRLLAKAVDSFGKGRDTGDFIPRGAAEIRLAARAYNLMRQRILRHLSQRTEMLAAVSHDLRTPLTRMRLELELMNADADPVLAGLRADVLEMTELVDTYLAFARGEGREAIEPTPLRPVLTALRERVERQGLAAELEVDEALVLPLRPIAIRRCLSNLVDNACRYGRWVGISARRVERFVEIAVEDDGPGIPPADREAALQPFTRLQGAKSRPSGGLGLGLAIARDIVLGHGGELTLGRSLRGGLRAMVRLPV
jgi:two-component system osmolarity sensor histidine kinase EnvZ